MMGNKRLAEIRDDLAQELDRIGLAPAEWYERQLQRLRTEAQPDPADLESLELIRDALQSLRQPSGVGGR